MITSHICFAKPSESKNIFSSGKSAACHFFAEQMPSCRQPTSYLLKPFVTFALALLMFQQNVGDALMAMQEQVYSALEWIENDRPRHWHQQELKAFDQISEARIAL